MQCIPVQTLRLRPAARMLLTLLATACGTGESTLPDPDPVPSEWGGLRVSARLAPDSVRIAFACSNVRAAGPIRVNNAGEFAISGLLRRSAVEDAPVTLRGTLRGDTLSLGHLTRPGSDPEMLAYRAVRGQAADFAGFYCTQE